MFILSEQLLNYLTLLFIMVSEMGFMFNMVMVGLSITLGLLVPKIAILNALSGTGRSSTSSKSTCQGQLSKTNMRVPTTTRTRVVTVKRIWPSDS